MKNELKRISFPLPRPAAAAGPARRRRRRPGSARRRQARRLVQVWSPGSAAAQRPLLFYN